MERSSPPCALSAQGGTLVAGGEMIVAERKRGLLSLQGAVPLSAWPRRAAAGGTARADG
jgi:hypothetical protein